ncbi:hypothetical protein [Synechococcus sp. CS-1332]|uniref:hypothetical protein n=1 Tax=Synechococcus sp. CS-1332 TaxID=2847972 RepID=UPI00223B479D|nr:hypothetical protein [Synechococcus sp. CS-1332]
MAPGTASGPGSSALLSCLGFPGWGGVHLILPNRGDPPALARRLHGCAPTMPAGHLLPALLRRHRDLEPLDPGHWPWAREAPMAWPQAWGHRYLLVCRWGAASPLRISAWQRQRGVGDWIRLCEPVPLPCFRERFLGAQEMTRATPSPTTIKAMAPTAQ